MQTMLWYNRQRSVIGASTGGGDDTQSTQGIVHGHAYAVINVKRVDRFQMVQVRVQEKCEVVSWPGSPHGCLFAEQL